jgi:transcriptional regulator with XRE-family HTH domain
MAKPNKPGMFAGMIRARMRELRWSQLDLSKAYGCDRQRIKMLLRQSNMTEAVFVRCLELLGLDVELRQTARPLPPLTALERRIALRAATASERYGNVQAAAELRALLESSPDGVGIERSDFDAAMRRCQKAIYRGKVMAQGYDPDVVLEEAWR